MLCYESSPCVSERNGPLPIRSRAALLFFVLMLAGIIDVAHGGQMPGYRGRSTGTSLFPRIGGQNFEYLYRAMREYRDGQRRMGWAPAMMSDAVKGFSDDDLKDIARHFGSMRW
jgi:hypothetical protein